MSAAARKRIGEATRKRWPGVKSRKGVAGKAKTQNDVPEDKGPARGPEKKNSLPRCDPASGGAGAAIGRHDRLESGRRYFG